MRWNVDKGRGSSILLRVEAGVLLAIVLLLYAQAIWPVVEWLGALYAQIFGWPTGA